MIKTKVSCLVALAGLAVAIGCSSQADSGPSPTAAAVSAAAATPAVTPAMLEKGGAIYKANCAACHGEGGKGDGPGAGVLKPPPRDHTDPVYMKTLTDKNIADVIVMGGAMRGKPLMPSHPQLRGAELDALVAFVRSLSTGK
jgi:mono/diheme cytochrome c family protein